MKSRVKFAAVFGWLPLLVFVALASAAFASTWNEQVLYSFQGAATGFWPAGGVVFDKAGNLYGATQGAGGDNCSPDADLCGLAYELSPPAEKGDPWTETVLVQFKGKQSNDVSRPSSGLVIDKTGNLYGASALGGAGGCVILGTLGGCGTVYELSPPTQKGGPWTETILYSFKGGDDGYYPWGDLAYGKDGNLYGATSFGGGKGSTCNIFFGGNCGVVFRLSPPKEKGGKWTEEILHRFAGGTDGAVPNGGLLLDDRGALYGTTSSGGNQGCSQEYVSVGCGTVFKLVAGRGGRRWTEKQLDVFSGGSDGGGPISGLNYGPAGDLYGVAGYGKSELGVVYRMRRTQAGRWVEDLLHTFEDRGDGRDPWGPVTFDSHGNLYGTATISGNYHGAVFLMKSPSGSDKKWAFSSLYQFPGSPNGAYPTAHLIFGKRGSLYSTTEAGGGTQCGDSTCGTVFEISP